jgi:hypothetical protein
VGIAAISCSQHNRKSKSCNWDFLVTRITKLVLGMAKFSQRHIRSPNPRNPKAVRNQKSASGAPPLTSPGGQPAGFRDSDCGISFGCLVSGFAAFRIGNWDWPRD